jgi:uncharacterized protein (DUF1810 family)
MGDPYNLRRFVDAQDPVFAEPPRGRKSGHWMWFIFPQIAGLDHSRHPNLRFASLAEAEA